MRKVGVYLHTLFRLLKLFCGFSKMRLMIIMLARIASFGFFAASIILLTMLVSGLTTTAEKKLSFLQFEFSFTENYSLISLGAIVFVIVSALLTYLYRLLLLNASVKLGLSSIQVAYLSIQKAAGVGDGYPKQVVALLTRRDPNVLARLYREVLDSLINIPIVAFIFSVLIYLSISLSASLIIPLVLLLPAYALISIKAKNYTLESENNQKKFRAPSKKLDQLLDESKLPQEADDEVYRKLIYGKAGLSYQYSIFSKKLRSQYLSQFISMLLLGAAVGVVILVGGEEVSAGELTLTELGIYILLLKPLHGAFQSAMATSTLYSRFYPNAHRYLTLCGY